MQQTQDQVAPSVPFVSKAELLEIVPLDDQMLGQVVGGAAAFGPGTGWFVATTGPGNGW